MVNITRLTTRRSCFPTGLAHVLTLSATFCPVFFKYATWTCTDGCVSPAAQRPGLGQQSTPHLRKRSRRDGLLLDPIKHVSNRAARELSGKDRLYCFEWVTRSCAERAPHSCNVLQGVVGGAYQPEGVAESRRDTGAPVQEANDQAERDIVLA